MAKIKDGLLGMISGKLGPIVVATRGETTYVRTAPTYSDESWSESQVKNRDRFKRVSWFCKQFKDTVIKPIWNLVPGPASGYHKFLGRNIKAFDLEGNSTDLSMLRFSEGPLPAPFYAMADRQAGQITVTWQDEPGQSRLRQSDELWYMAVKDGKTTINGENVGPITIGPIVIGPHQTSVTRNRMEAVIANVDESITGLYLFFAASDRKGFSPDRYLVV